MAKLGSASNTDYFEDVDAIMRCRALLWDDPQANNGRQIRSFAKFKEIHVQKTACWSAESKIWNAEMKEVQLQHFVLKKMWSSTVESKYIPVITGNADSDCTHDSGNSVALGHN